MTTTHTDLRAEITRLVELLAAHPEQAVPLAVAIHEAIEVGYRHTYTADAQRAVARCLNDLVDGRYGVADTVTGIGWSL